MQLGGYHTLQDSYVLEKVKKLLPALECATKEGECADEDAMLAYRAYCSRAFELMTQAAQNFEDMWDCQTEWLGVYECAVEIAEQLTVISSELTSASTKDLKSLANTVLFIKRRSSSFRSANTCCGVLLGIHSKNILHALNSLHHHKESLGLADPCMPCAASRSNSISNTNVVNHVTSDEERFSEGSTMAEPVVEEISECMPSPKHSKEITSEINAVNSREMTVGTMQAMHTSALVFPDDELIVKGSFSLTTAQEQTLEDGLREFYESSESSNSAVVAHDESNDTIEARYKNLKAAGCDFQSPFGGSIPALEDLRASSSKSSPILDFVPPSYPISTAHQIHSLSGVDSDANPSTSTALVWENPVPLVVDTNPTKVMEACCYCQSIISSEIESFLVPPNGDGACRLTVVKGAAEHCLHYLLNTLMASSEIQSKYGKFCLHMNAGEVGMSGNSAHKLLDMIHTKLSKFEPMTGPASSLIAGWDVESLVFQSQKLLASKEWLLVIENISPVHLEVLQSLLLQDVRILASSSVFDDNVMIDGVQSFDIDALHCHSRRRSLEMVLDCCGLSPDAKEVDRLCTSLDIVGYQCSTVRSLATLLEWNMAYGGDSVESAVDDIKENLVNECYNFCTSTLQVLKLSMLCLSIHDQERYTSVSVLPSCISISVEIFAALWGDTNPSDTKKNLQKLERFSLIDKCSCDQWRVNSSQSKFANAQTESFGQAIEEATSRLAEYLSTNEQFMKLFTTKKHLLVRLWEGIPPENLKSCLVRKAKSCLESDVAFVGSVVEFLLGFGAYHLAEELGNILLDHNHIQSVHMTMNLMSAVAFVLEAEDDLKASESVWRAIVSFYRDNGEHGTIELADSLSQLCLLLLQMDRLEEAEKLQNEALAEWKVLVDHDHPKIMRSMVVLSDIFKGQGELHLSEMALRSAIGSKQMLWGESHPRVFELVKTLLCLLKCKPDIQGIVDLQNTLLGILPGASRLGVVDASWLVRDMSVELEKAGKLGAAEKGLRFVCELFDDRDHYFLGEMLSTLGSLLDRCGKFEDARAILTHALAVKERSLGANHPDVAAGMNGLACVLCRSGMFAESESLHRKALSMRQRLFGDISAEVATSYTNLGSVLEAAQQFREAETAMQQALIVWKEIEGEQSICVASAMNALGVILEDQYRFRDAEVHHRNALHIWMTVKGVQEIEIASAKCALANAIENLKKYREAEELYRCALALFKKEPTINSAMIASTMNSLGLVLESQDLLAEAEEMHKGALSMWRQLRGEHHPDVVTSMTNLGFVLEGRGDLAGAEMLMANALAVSKVVYGSKNMEVCTAMENLFEILGAAGKNKEAGKLDVSIRLWKQKYYHSQP